MHQTKTEGLNTATPQTPVLSINEDNQTCKQVFCNLAKPAEFIIPDSNFHWVT